MRKMSLCLLTFLFVVAVGVPSDAEKKTGLKMRPAIMLWRRAIAQAARMENVLFKKRKSPISAVISLRNSGQN